MDYYTQTIYDALEDQDRDLKFKLGDNVISLNHDLTPTIAYDYLNISDDLEFSFHHSEFHNKSCEEFPDKTDSDIYFEKIKSICNKKLCDSLNNSHYSERFKIISPNRTILNVAKKLFKVSQFRHEELPQFGEFGLYTNDIGDKAPRIFFFFGDYGIIYILFYDPFHKVFPKKND